MISSCRQSIQKEENILPNEILTYIPSPIENSDSLFQFLEMVSLKNAPFRIMSVNRLIEAEMGYFILDKYSNRLSLFDKKGEFIRSFGEIGAGPGEYGAIYDFFLDENLVYLFSPSDLSLFAYEIATGEFRSKSSFSVFAQRIVQVSKQELLVYVSNNPTDTNNNVYLYDLTGNQLKAFFPYDPVRSNSIVPYTGFLAKGSQDAFYCEPFGDMIYKYDPQKKEFTPEFKLGFVSPELKEDRENFEKYTGEYQLDPQNKVRFPGGNFLSNDRWFLMDMTYDAKLQFVLMDLNDNSRIFTLARRVENEFYKFINKPVYLNGNNELYFILNHEILENYKGTRSTQLVKSIFEAAPTQSDSLDFHLIKVSIKI